jgi:hypothetical protein
MKKRIRSTWVSRKEKSIWCCDFSSFGSDRAGVLAELAASEAVIDRERENSLLVAVDLYRVRMEPELVAFFQNYGQPASNPVRKMAIVHISGVRRLWLQVARGVRWPPRAKFFEDYEEAKDWLVGEKF